MLSNDQLEKMFQQMKILSSVPLLTYLVYYNIILQRFVYSFISGLHCKQKQRSFSFRQYFPKSKITKPTRKCVQKTIFWATQESLVCIRRYIFYQKWYIVFTFHMRHALQKFIMLHDNIMLTLAIISGMQRCKNLLLVICCNSVTGKPWNSTCVIIISHAFLKQSR